MLRKLIKSNFKNDFSHLITYFLIMVLAVLMLHTGLAVFRGYETLHEDKKEKYNFADIMVRCNLSPEDIDALEAILAEADYIGSYEKLNPVVMEMQRREEEEKANTQNIYDDHYHYLMTLPYGGWGEIEAPHFIELSDREYENPIYISSYFSSDIFCAKPGDTIELKMNGEYMTFQVAGVFESLLSSSYGFTYVSPELYEKWKAEDAEKREKLLLEHSEEDASDLYERTFFVSTLADGYKVSDAAGQLTKALSEKELTANVFDVENTINDLTYMQNVIAAMLAAIAVIITIIAMIIIYFRITNSIEQNIENIGAEKSLGYTSKQIRLSIILEFLLSTAGAVAVGIGLSYVVIAAFEEKIRYFSGVEWEHPFDPVSFLITVLLILGTAFLVSFLSTRVIKRMDPVIALRFGLDSHSFKKNHAPIERSRGPLTWILAKKSVLSSLKQNVILFVVMLAIGIVTTFAVYMWYNCVHDASHLYRMLNLVASDVDLKFSDDADHRKEIEALPEVENAFWLDSFELTVAGYSCDATVTEDWSAITEVNVYEGRSPKYENEIAIGGSLADTLGVTIGDEVTVSYGKVEKKYLITGLEQSAQSQGKDVSLTEEGAKSLGYEPEITQIGVFVKNHALKNTKSLVKKVQEMYGDRLQAYGDAIETLSSGDNQIITIASIIVGTMVVICLIVIVLSLNLLVKTLIIRRQKEIGIKKALGFSSRQLRTELILSMLPQIGVGALVGSILGGLWSNPILSNLLTSLGIMKSGMEVFAWMVALSVGFALVASFVIIWIISRRIKRISAYTLITE